MLYANNKRKKQQQKTDQNEKKKMKVSRYKYYQSTSFTLRKSLCDPPPADVG